MLDYCDCCGAPIDPAPPAPVKIGPCLLVLENGRHVLRYSGHSVSLQPKQADVLALLAKRRQLSRDVVMAVLFEEAEHDNCANVTVCLLRKALARLPGAPLRIVNVNSAKRGQMAVWKLEEAPGRA